MASCPALSDSLVAIMRQSEPYIPRERFFRSCRRRGIGLVLAVSVLAHSALAQPAKAPVPPGKAAPAKTTPAKPPATNPASAPKPAAPTPAITEENLFKAAMKALEDGGALLEYAERDFAAFVAQFPKSPRLPQAVLGQAQTQFKRGKHKEARELLGKRFAAAGKLTDEYLYWIAECELQLQKYKEAEQGFAQLVKDYPGTARSLQASYGQGEALLKQKNYPAVIKLLNDPKGVFRTQAALRPKDEIGVLGLLTLGEALLAGGQLEAYEPLRSELNHRIDSVDSLSIELHWRWKHLEYRNSMAGKQVEKALGYANSLITMAAEIVDKEWLAESIECKAEALIDLGRADDAVATYQEALDAKMPPHRRREALDRIVVLRIGQKKNAESIDYLGTILTNFPTAPDLDLVHLTIGEMSLDEFVAGRSDPAPVSPEVLDNTTNYLGLAHLRFQQVITNFPDSARLDLAFLHRGECYEFAGEDAKALNDFTSAAARAKATTNRVLQARAIFKMGDAHFKLTNYLAATTNYLRMLDQFGGLAEIKNSFGDRAIYQIATAAVRLNDLHLAQTALGRMRTDFPVSELHERAALLVGQALNNAGENDRALTVVLSCIEDFEKNGAKLALRPQLILASSAAYSSMGEFAKGIAVVSDWLKSVEKTKHPLIPRAEFEQGRLNARAGQLTNTVAIYTRFVDAHKTNQLAGYARQWLADYYFNKIGENEKNAPIAEKHYQLVFQSTNWPASELTYRARFMAGSCALTRQGWSEARDYFSQLAGDKEASDEWRARAYFAIGELTINEPQGDRVGRWSKAINVFNEIDNNYTNTTFHPLALGRLGHCNFQKGGLLKEEQHYDDAISFYQRVLDHPAANVVSRSEARYAMGFALKAKAGMKNPPDPKLLVAARDEWRKLYHYEKENQERPDPYWMERATRAFAQSLIDDGDEQTAVSVYRRLQMDLPHLHDSLEARIKSLTSPTNARTPPAGAN